MNRLFFCSAPARRCRSAWVLAVALLLASAAAAQEAEETPPPATPEGNSGGGAVMTERLLVSPPPGWKKGASTTSRTMVVNHLFPPGQTTETWSEMLTIQVIADPRTNARGVVNRVSEASRTGCDVSAPSPVSEGILNNYPVATMTVTCNRGHQSGKGGLVAVKAIRGQQALFVVERLWRGPAFGPNEAVPIPAETLQEWAAFLRNVTVCDEADPRHHPCPP